MTNTTVKKMNSISKITNKEWLVILQLKTYWAAGVEKDQFFFTKSSELVDKAWLVTTLKLSTMCQMMAELWTKNKTPYLHISLGFKNKIEQQTDFWLHRWWVASFMGLLKDTNTLTLHLQYVYPMSIVCIPMSKCLSVCVFNKSALKYYTESWILTYTCMLLYYGVCECVSAWRMWFVDTLWMAIFRPMRPRLVKLLRFGVCKIGVVAKFFLSFFYILCTKIYVCVCTWRVVIYFYYPLMTFLIVNVKVVSLDYIYLFSLVSLFFMFSYWQLYLFYFNAFVV